MEQHCVVSIDNIDIMFDAPFRNGFFGMLRQWHEMRHRAPWNKLSLILASSTEPYALVDDLAQSPFNVGELIRLADFSAEQVADLNERHGSPFLPSELQALIALVGGHPYLIRRALYEVSEKMYSATSLLAQATQHRGPFGAHLRPLAQLISQKQTLRKAVQEIVQQQKCTDDQSRWRLESAGLIRINDRAIVPRYPLYNPLFERFTDA